MSTKPHSRWLGALLWVAAVFIMLATAVYQRRTGPTYPMRGEVTVGAQSSSFRLVRSQETTERARVALPRPGPAAGGTISYRRYPTSDPFTVEELQTETGEDGEELVGYLPIQPAAGKVEYFVELRSGGSTGRIPEAAAEESTIILRYKDPVPTKLLVAHVVFMFFSVLIGMRAGLGAQFAPSNIRSLSWGTLVGMTIGGLILGPFVQKYAFGAYWTGFPWGYDLTDNKLLIMWIVWVVAVLVLVKMKDKAGAGRLAVALAALVMTVVYLIPHSMRGSELNYDAVDAGVSASEAVGTSKD